ncbi:MAG TPA: MFS transporter [Polyangiaceae bacterium]|nr:MFS transporter [Polyangiaceae bacterium]
MTEPPSRWTLVSRPFEHRNYRLFFAGQLVSLVGSWTQSVAQSWLVYRLTGSPLWLGIVAFCQQAPVFVLATLGGSVADGVSRRSVLVVTQATAMMLAFTLAALTLTGVVGVGQILLLATLLGAVNAVDIPTRQSFTVEMVGRDHLMNAVALNSSMVNGARILGPAIAGFAITAFGEGWCFLLNGISFVAVIAGLLAMRDLPGPVGEAKSESMHAGVLAGFRFAAAERRVRAVLALFAVTAVSAIPHSTLMPIFAAQVFHGDGRTLGWLMGATGAGALLGALTLASREHVEHTLHWIGGACFVFGTMVVLFALSKTLWLSLLLLVPLGGAMMIQLSATNTLLQTLTPDALRGRVIAIWAMIFTGFAPVGSIVAGSLAATVGPSRTLVASGGVCACAALVFARWLSKTQSSNESAPSGSSGAE